MKIRAATTHDVPAMLAIYAPYILDTPVSFETEVPSVEEFTRRFLEKTATHPWLVLEESGEVAGYAYAGPFHARAAYAWSAEVSIYLRPSAQGKGHGKALYKYLLNLLERQGIVNIIGGLTLPNTASQRLHESFGFTPVARYKDIGFKLGRWWDVGYWQLQLERPASPNPPTYS